MRQDIARMQTERAAEANTLQSIDINFSTSIDDNPLPSIPTKSIQDSYTRAELDQIVQAIYGTLGASKERLDMRCDDIYFPWNNTISSLTSQIEAMHREIAKIQRYIASRSEASTSINRWINISTDSHNEMSIDEATPTDRGQLVTKVTSDMSDVNNHGKEILDDTYASLVRHQFDLECLGDILQKIENATATMNDKWRRGDKAM